VSSPSTDQDADVELTRLASLSEPTRRLLYQFVATAAAPVSRDQAASGAGVPRHVAKFHLDKLTDDGLLDVNYRRPEGRSGPGAGRPTKLYRRAQKDLSISLPPRHYELAAELMARAISATRTTGTPIRETLRLAARAEGRRLIENAPKTGGRGRTAVVNTICSVLTETGYEPCRESGEPARIVLANCPFRRLAEDHTELVCELNLDLISGLVDSRPAARLTAHLDPAPGRCCVTLTTASGRYS
jgi:predicted ArsR family transcriptional regulator